MGLGQSKEQIQKLNDEIKNYEELLKESNDNYEELKHKFDTLDIEANDYKIKFEDAQYKVKQKDNINSELQQTVNQYKIDTTQIKEKLNDANNKIDELEVDKDIMSYQLEEVSRVLGKLKTILGYTLIPKLTIPKHELILKDTDKLIEELLKIEQKTNSSTKVNHPFKNYTNYLSTYAQTIKAKVEKLMKPIEETDLTTNVKSISDYNTKLQKLITKSNLKIEDLNELIKELNAKSYERFTNYAVEYIRNQDTLNDQTKRNVTNLEILACTFITWFNTINPFFEFLKNVHDLLTDTLVQAFEELAVLPETKTREELLEIRKQRQLESLSQNQDNKNSQNEENNQVNVERFKGFLRKKDFRAFAIIITLIIGICIGYNLALFMYRPYILSSKLNKKIPIMGKC